MNITFPGWLRDPGSSFEFVTWLRKFIENEDIDRPGSRSTAASTERDLEVVLDGVGSQLTLGVHGDVRIDFACVIEGWTVLADQVGSISIDIWKKAYAGFPPTVANTITASAKPTLSSTDHNTSTTLTGWTTAIAAGDTLRFNVDSVSTITRVTLVLHMKG